MHALGTLYGIDGYPTIAQPLTAEIIVRFCVVWEKKIFLPEQRYKLDKP